MERRWGGVVTYDKAGQAEKSKVIQGFRDHDKDFRFFPRDSGKSRKV